MLFAVESLLRSVDWRVEPYSEDPADLEAAEFLDQCRLDTSHTWEDFIAEALSMAVYGWSFFEQVYKIRGGPNETDSKYRSKYSDRRIGWRKFAFRSQDSLHKWEFDPDGGIKGIYQQPIGDMIVHHPEMIYIPIQKGLLFRTTSRKNNPEGRSLLRTAYRSWHYQTRLQEIEAIGIERDMTGLPTMGVPIELLLSGKTAEAAATYEYLKDLVTKIRMDEQMGALIPRVFDDNNNELYKFELMTSGGRRQIDTSAIIERYSLEILSSLMADWLALGHESVGSFALSSDKTELFAVALGAILDSIEETLNRHAVPQLFALNTFQVEQFPQLKHGDIEKPNLIELAQYVKEMAAAGAPMFPDTELENMMREVGDLPLVDPLEREEQMMAQQQQMMPFEFGGQPPPGGNGGGNPNVDMVF
jgi:hypothetical protein